MLPAFGLGAPAWVASVLAVAISASVALSRVAMTGGRVFGGEREGAGLGYAARRDVPVVREELGAALFTATLSAWSGAQDAMSRLHVGVDVGYSDIFLALAVPLLMPLLVSFKLTKLSAGSK